MFAREAGVGKPKAMAIEAPQRTAQDYDDVESALAGAASRIGAEWFLRSGDGVIVFRRAPDGIGYWKAELFKKGAWYHWPKDWPKEVLNLPAGARPLSKRAAEDGGEILDNPRGPACGVDAFGIYKHRGGCCPGRPSCRRQRREEGLCYCAAYHYPHRSGSGRCGSPEQMDRLLYGPRSRDAEEEMRHGVRRRDAADGAGAEHQSDGRHRVGRPGAALHDRLSRDVVGAEASTTLTSDDQIAHMYAEGMSLRDIASALSVSKNYVDRALRKHGVDRRTKIAAGRTPQALMRAGRTDPKTEQRIVEMYQSGQPTETIAAAFGLAPSTVSEILVRHGIATRGMAWRRTPLGTEQKAVELYGQGKSLVEVGRELGLSHTAVRNILMRRDVLRRPARVLGSGEADEQPHEAAEQSAPSNEADAVPWVKLERDPAAYAAQIAMAEAHGKIDSAGAVYSMLAPSLAKEDQETFLVVGVDIRGQCRGVVLVHKGARSRVSVDVPEILRTANALGGEMFIVVHNHPTTRANPSPADKSLTKAIEKAARASEQVMMDHVIIGMGEYFSFAENKLTKVGGKRETRTKPKAATAPSTAANEEPVAGGYTEHAFFVAPRYFPHWLLSYPPWSGPPGSDWRLVEVEYPAGPEPWDEIGFSSKAADVYRILDQMHTPREAAKWYAAGAPSTTFGKHTRSWLDLFTPLYNGSPIAWFDRGGSFERFAKLIDFHKYKQGSSLGKKKGSFYAMSYADFESGNWPKEVEQLGAWEAAEGEAQEQQRLFHGTKHAHVATLTPSTGGEFGPGIYLTADPNTARFFAGNARGPDAPTVLEVVADIRNPFRIAKVDWIKKTAHRTPSAVQRALKKKGHDAIIGVGLTGSEQIVVFDVDAVRIVGGGAREDRPADWDRQYVIAPQNTPQWLIPKRPAYLWSKAYPAIEVDVPEEYEEWAAVLKPFGLDPVTGPHGVSWADVRRDLFSSTPADYALPKLYRVVKRGPQARDVPIGDLAAAEGLKAVGVRHLGSPVWWCDLDLGPVAAASLYDLARFDQPYTIPRKELRADVIGVIEGEVDKEVIKQRRKKIMQFAGKKLWLLSLQQWDDAEWPPESQGGPPYTEHVSTARDK